LMSVTVFVGAIAVQLMVSPAAAFKMQKGRLPVSIATLPTVSSAELVLTDQVAPCKEAKEMKHIRKGKRTGEPLHLILKKRMNIKY